MSSTMDQIASALRHLASKQEKEKKPDAEA